MLKDSPDDEFRGLGSSQRGCLYCRGGAEGRARVRGAGRVKCGDRERELHASLMACFAHGMLALACGGGWKSNFFFSGAPLVFF